MKYYIKGLAVVFLFMGLMSCNNTTTSANNSGAIAQEKGTIEVLAPTAMYEVLKDSPDSQLVDVRTEGEYQVGHLRDAQNICVTDTDFREKVQDLDKEKPVYVYCKKGGRSAKAAKILQELGFKEIYDLEGGITKWQRSSLEVAQ